jgi:hypothetical protein
MNNIKTYEGFFDFFKKKHSEDDQIILEYINRLKKVKDISPYDIKKDDHVDESYSILRFKVNFEDTPIRCTKVKSHRGDGFGEKSQELLLERNLLRKNNGEFYGMVAIVDDEEEPLKSNVALLEQLYNLIDDVYKRHTDASRISKIKNSLNKAADKLESIRYNESTDWEPNQDQVEKWINYLNDEKNYTISKFRDMKMIDISGKSRYISGPLLAKSRLKQQIFNDITDKEKDIHEPSLRRAISTWIDQQSKVNENFSAEFDLEFALAKIKDQFTFEKVKKMLDTEVLEWIPESGEEVSEETTQEAAKDIIIDHMIDWYEKTYPSADQSPEITNQLIEGIKRDYDFLK